MKALVIYDLQYGNTEKIAQALGAALQRCARRLLRFSGPG